LSHAFNLSKESHIKESHLWFSIFMRSERSRFTRVQRVSTCMALLYLSMLVDAMWYGTVEEDSPDAILSLAAGKIRVTAQQIYVGVMSNLLTFPMAFLIIFFFRKSRRMRLRKNRIDKAITEQEHRVKWEQEQDEQGDEDDDDDENDDQVEQRDERKRQHLEHYHDSGRRRKKLILPWPFFLIGWALCILSILVSGFLMFAYAVQFGNDLTYKWLSSLIFSFFSGLLFLEPLKVFLIAMFLSCLCKNVDLDDDDVDDDEERASVVASEEEWWGTRTTNAGNKGLPIDEEFLELVRRARKKEVEMWAIIRELFGYFLFILIVYVISYGNRDPMSFKFKTVIESNFIVLPGFDKVINLFSNCLAN